MTPSTLLTRSLGALFVLLLVCTPLVQAQAPTATGPKTPTEAYLGYRAAMLKAKSLDQLKPWLSKDGVAQLEAMPADQRGMMFEMIQDLSGAITNVKVVKETIAGDTASLQVEGTDTGDKSVKKATVAIVREGGVWKFVKESWGSR